MNQLDQLRQYTTVVADTGSFHQMARFAPQDATTNPSLILKAAQQAEYAPLLAQTVARHRGLALPAVVDQVLVRFGLGIGVARQSLGQDPTSDPVAGFDHQAVGAVGHQPVGGREPRHPGTDDHNPRGPRVCHGRSVGSVSGPGRIEGCGWSVLCWDATCRFSSSNSLRLRTNRPRRPTIMNGR